MGLVVDTDVLINIEKGGFPPDWATYASRYAETYISAMTVSELLVGVHRADTQTRRLKRSAFLESVLSKVTVLDFTEEVARIHAQALADLAGRGERIGAHDLIIAATALRHGYAVLTSNTKEFGRVVGLDVVAFTNSKDIKEENS